MIGRLVSQSSVPREPRLSPLRCKIDAYTYLPHSVLAFPDKLSLKKKMEACGLEDVKFFTRTLGVVTIHIGKKPSRP